MKASKVLLLFFSLITITGFSQVNFSVSTDAKKIVQGSYVDIIFMLENGKESNFIPPKVEGLTFAGGPSTSTNMSIYNGRKTSNKKWSFSYIGKKVGTFTVGAASIVVQGKTYKTKPFSIEVIKGKGKKESQEDCFVKITASDSSAYLGQQIILTYKLYTILNVQQYDIVNESDYEGFYVMGLNKKVRYEREILDGVEYFVKDLHKLALFPQQVGTFEIPTTQVTLGIAKQNSRSIFNRIEKRINTIANGFNITVQDLPPNAPISFSGAVGNFSMTAKNKKTTVSTDDAVVITMNINGNGDPKMIEAPKWDLPEAFEWYDPNTTKEDQSNKGFAITCFEAYEYILVPKKTGRFILKPEFTYFNTDSNKYVTIGPKNFNVSVVQGSNIQQSNIEEEKEIQLASIFTSTRLKKIKKPKFFKWLYLLGLGLLGCIVIGLLGYKRKLVAEGHFDALVQRKKKAKLKIITELNNELAQVKATNSKGYIEILSLKLRKYLTQKFKDTDIQLTDDEIIALFKTKDITPSIIERTEDFLKKAEMSIYAGVSSENKEQLKSQLIDIINNVESLINEKSVPK